MSELFLCDVDDIEDGRAISVSALVSGTQQALVLVRRDEEVFAYINECPHFSVRLDYRPGKFEVYQKRVLMCAHHSALFRIEDGYCIEGPCAGNRLQIVPVSVVEGAVFRTSSLA
ncbi:Rieske 2Fe-2S domain-containing protein [Pseudomonas salomonii]|uniref:Rieske 2Fe-2S domain-containing protein n=2 Tax=Pseudomonas TaxID=286 RepID=A0A7Y8GII9_9PSED|nr:MULTISPECIES: Rieske 2Fe-2S domain-containing protein [Pseudomonas]NWF10887.1 Rieske 2Fe-2S domain-containing protein [Pseudomonas salomonii]